jgi:hypothetical protein
MNNRSVQVVTVTRKAKLQSKPVSLSRRSAVLQIIERDLIKVNKPHIDDVTLRIIETVVIW